MSFLLNLQNAKNKKIITHRSNNKSIKPLEKNSGYEAGIMPWISAPIDNVLNVW